MKLCLIVFFKTFLPNPVVPARKWLMVVQAESRTGAVIFIRVSYAKAGDLTADFFFFNQIIIICNHITETAAEYYWGMKTLSLFYLRSYFPFRVPINDIDKGSHQVIKLN